MIIGRFPFERQVAKHEEVAYQKFLRKIHPFYNHNNFTKTYLPNVYNKIALSEFEFLEVYTFELLKNWIWANEAYTLEYINAYNKLIKFLKIEPKFSFAERAYLEKISGIEFTINRKLKSLIPYFDLLENEVAYFFYEQLILRTTTTNDRVPKIFIGNLSITNKRIGFIDDVGTYFFAFEDIKVLSLKSNSVLIELNHIKLNFETNSPEILYVSLDRIIALGGYQV